MTWQSFRSSTVIVGALLPSLVTTAGAAAQVPCTDRHELSISGVTLSLEAVKPSVTLGEPIMVVLTIRSSLQESIRVDLGKNHKQGLVFTVEDSLGRVSDRRIQEPPEGGIYLPGEEVVHPGKVYVRKLLLNEWYQPEKAGRHSVFGCIEGTVATLTGRALGSLNPAAVTIQVLPRNKEILRQVCAELEDLACSSDVEVASEAALALGYVADQVAIPFLTRVLLVGGPGAQNAIEGLGRIGGDSAAEALVGVFNSLRGFERLQGQAQLTHLRGSVTNARLLKQIDEILRERPKLFSEDGSLDQ